MSKRALKTYVGSLKKKELEAQIIDLYERFGEVKTFYDFVFNPKEEKLVREAKLKISKEYFPESRRKAKTRRSVAQKIIKHYKKLEMDPVMLADVMLYNVEIAQTYSAEKEIKEAFSKSIYKSFEEAVNFIIQNGITEQFFLRLSKIETNIKEQDWPNRYRFEKLMDQFH